MNKKNLILTIFLIGFVFSLPVVTRAASDSFWSRLFNPSMRAQTRYAEPTSVVPTRTVTQPTNSTIISPVAEKVILLGGETWANNNQSFNDVWSSADLNNWKLVTPAAGWSPRAAFGATYFKGKLWVIGGEGSNNFNDVWSSSDNGATWKQEVSNAPWGQRWNHSIVVFQNKLWLLGGNSNPPNSWLNDIWVSSDGVNWALVAQSAPWEPGVGRAVTVFQDKIWLLGGGEYIGGTNTYATNNIWNSQDGINWTQIKNNMPNRSFHSALVYKKQLWILGGDSGSSQMNDVWSTTNGFNWVQVTPFSSWQARSEFSAIVFNGKMVITGGYPRIPNGLEYNDVWSSTNGSTWNLETSGASWKTRFSHQMVVIIPSSPSTPVVSETASEIATPIFPPTTTLDTSITIKPLTYTQTLRPGATGTSVTALQNVLKQLGYTIPTNELGKYGKGTAKAVEAVQKRVGLKADFVVGKGTVTAINQLLPKGAPVTTTEAVCKNSTKLIITSYNDSAYNTNPDPASGGKNEIKIGGQKQGLALFTLYPTCNVKINGLLIANDDWVTWPNFQNAFSNYYAHDGFAVSGGDSFGSSISSPVLGQTSATLGGNVINFTQPLTLTANQAKIIAISGDVKSSVPPTNSAASGGGNRSKICLYQPIGLTDWNGNPITISPQNSFFQSTIYGYDVCSWENGFKLAGLPSKVFKEKVIPLSQ